MSDLLANTFEFESNPSSSDPPREAIIPTVIIDRCALFREGLKDALGGSAFTVVASTADLKDVRLSNASSSAPLLIILAASGNLGDDVTALKLARAQFLYATTVSLCRECQPQHAAALFAAGVGAILLTPSRFENFIEALELAMLGQHVVPLHLIDSCVRSDSVEPEEAVAEAWPVSPEKPGERPSRLSIREVEIVQCLLAGEPNRSIAQRLMISEATVKVHVKAILRKIKVKNRTQAAIWAVNNIEAGSICVSTDRSRHAPMLGSAGLSAQYRDVPGSMAPPISLPPMARPASDAWRLMPA